MAAISLGPRSWTFDRDDYGYRTYRVVYQVAADRSDSLYNVMHASGLPTVGSPFSLWGFLGQDQWVWCRPEMSVRIDQEREGDPAQYYRVECVFSNRWEGSEQSLRCNTNEIMDPMFEPMRISGGFRAIPWEAKYDKDYSRLVTSANEPLSGAAVTYEYARPTVRIEQNVHDLDLDLIGTMVNTVNDRTLWDAPARCVKLANVSWQRKVWGLCWYFYIRVLDFEIDVYNHDKDGNQIGFDHEAYDMGSRVLRGQWVVDTEDPYYGYYRILSTYPSIIPEERELFPAGEVQAYKDKNCEFTRVFLDGYGRPANTPVVWNELGTGTGTGDTTAVTGPPATWRIQFYRESNFLLLGIPTSL